MALDELTGARLLARTLAGDFRRPRESDIRRFWDATRELRGTLLFSTGVAEFERPLIGPDGPNVYIWTS